MTTRKRRNPIFLLQDRTKVAETEAVAVVVAEDVVVDAVVVDVVPAEEAAVAAPAHNTNLFKPLSKRFQPDRTLAAIRSAFSLGIISFIFTYYSLYLQSGDTGVLEKDFELTVGVRRVRSIRASDQLLPHKNKRNRSLRELLDQCSLNIISILYRWKIFNKWP
jgi:hypothetical protein